MSPPDRGILEKKFGSFARANITLINIAYRVII